jgi:hypothetical protein
VGKIILAVFNDVGSATAAIPVLKQLAEGGSTVYTTGIFTGEPNNPMDFGVATLRSAGFNPGVLDHNNLGVSLKKIIEEMRPDVIFCGVCSNDNGVDHKAIEIGAELNIPVVVIIESGPYEMFYWYRHRTPLYKTATKICVPDTPSLQKLFVEGFEKARLEPTGNPSWDGITAQMSKKDEYRRQVRQKFGIGDDEFLIMFSTTAYLDKSDEDVPGAVGWTGVSEKAVIRELLSAVTISMKEPTSCVQNRIRLVFRQKPGLGTSVIEEIIFKHEFFSNNDEVILDTARYPNGEIWFAPDVAIGCGTLALQDVALRGIPAFSYQPGRDPKTDSFPPNRMGLTIPMYQSGELWRLIFEIAHTPKDEFLVKAKTLAKGFKLVPNATENVAKVILDVANRIG